MPGFLAPTSKVFVVSRASNARGVIQTSDPGCSVEIPNDGVFMNLEANRNRRDMSLSLLGEANWTSSLS